MLERGASRCLPHVQASNQIPSSENNFHSDQKSIANLRRLLRSVLPIWQKKFNRQFLPDWQHSDIKYIYIAFILDFLLDGSLELRVKTSSNDS